MSDREPEHYPDPVALRVGTHVVFIGPEHVQSLTGLTTEHPGVVAGAGEKHADVRWVDKQDWWVHDGIFDPRWLRVVDERDFMARRTALRSSDWAGFPDLAPGHRRP